MPIPIEQVPPSFIRVHGRDRHGNFRIIVRKKFLEAFKKSPGTKWGVPISLTRVAQAQTLGPSLHAVDEIEIAFKKGTKHKTVKIAEKVFASPDEFIALYKTVMSRRKAVHPIALKYYTTGPYHGKYFLYTRFSTAPPLGNIHVDRMDYHARSNLSKNLAQALAKMHHYQPGRPAIIHYDTNPLNMLYESDRLAKDRIRFLDMDATSFLDRKPTIDERMEDLRFVVKHAVYSGLHRNPADVAAFAHHYCDREGLDFEKIHSKLLDVHNMAKERMRTYGD